MLNDKNCARIFVTGVQNNEKVYYCIFVTISGNYMFFSTLLVILVAEDFRLCAEPEVYLKPQIPNCTDGGVRAV